LIIAALVTLAFAVGGAAWWVVRTPPMVQPAEPTATTPVPLGAARASIAVLPLEALGAEGGSDYFADGLTEDIISALGRFRDLSVMSRSAVFAYKGKHPTPAEVRRDLKVRYVVEGSIRRALERIRVSVSLTDTNRSDVLWSEKYEAEPKGVFGVEDQITRRISGALAVRVTSLELARSTAKPPNDSEAYDLVSPHLQIFRHARNFAQGSCAWRADSRLSSLPTSSPGGTAFIPPQNLVW